MSMRGNLLRAVSLMALVALALFGVGCGGSSGGSGVGVGGGNYIVKLDGGAGSSGGDAGDFQVWSNASVSFRNTGIVDASFTVPSYAWTPSFGANKATVSATTTVPVILSDGTEPAAGTLYLVAGYTNLYKSDGDGIVAGDNDVVTGLQVASGVTLTLPAHTDWGSGVALQDVDLNFDYDVEINGIVKTGALDNTTLEYYDVPQRHGADATARDKAGLIIDANRILISATGSINAAGADGTTGQRGGDGGYIWLDTYNGFINRGTIVASGGAGSGAIGGLAAYSGYWGSDGVYIWNDGALVNAGAITASGGNGTAGGDAGWIELDAYTTVFNTAALTANGGTGSTESGGDADWIEFYSDTASVMNSGAITAKGGDGATGGGNGAWLEMVAGYDDTWVSGGENGYDVHYIGNTVNSGAITLSGGSATGTNGSGGDGGSVSDYGMIARGRLANSGAIVSVGGVGKGTGSGGDGGDLYLLVDFGVTYNSGTISAAGPVQVSGDINLAGGAAASTGDVSGGYGGDIDVYANNYPWDYYGGGQYPSTPAVLPVEFVGYASLSANGGAGVSYGGYAGGVGFYTRGSESRIFYEGGNYSGGSTYNEVYAPVNPSPAIYNSVPIQARGGATSGTEITAGYGGWVDFDAANMGPYVPGSGGPITVTNLASLDVQGGASSGTDGYGGYGGWVYMNAYNKVTNAGNIDGSGGAASGTGGTGGDAGYYGDTVHFDSTYDVVNSGTLKANGGSATGTNGCGGYGDDVYLHGGGLVTSTGAVYALGGNATGTGSNGDGGYIELYSQGGGSAYGTLSAAKGTGGTGGADGSVYVDDVRLSALSAI